MCVRDYKEASVAIRAAVSVVDALEVLSMERLMCCFAAVKWNQGLAGHLLPAVFIEGCTRWSPGMCLGLPGGLSEAWKSRVVVEASQDLDLGVWLCNRHLAHAKDPIPRVQV